MIILDTDHLSVLFFENHSQNESLTQHLQNSADRDIGTTVISLEEQMRGWLKAIKRRQNVLGQVLIYPRLTQLVDFYSEWEVAPFDERSADIYLSLKKQVRLGTQDLKIAAIALANDALLLSANLVHFQKVPGLKVEDWLYS